ncbi:MAG TPA: alpha/beta hydrolase [Candidatus Dormibacteraeota bacterium]|nr:alpha/beta hydrolase [Candidatus Dormibacteraeota bacterium]
MDFDSDGLRLHYEVHGPDDGAPIVLVHGFASHYRLNWVGTRWQETLTGAGFRVIGLDCRGHGESDKPHDSAAYVVPKMAGDVRNLLDHLDVETADYLGFSMGSRIGIQCVLDFPERLRRVVLGGVGIKGALAQAQSIARAMRGGVPENPVAKSFYEFAKARPHNDLEALATCIEAISRPLDMNVLRSVQTPILLVVGENDELVSGAEDLVELIPTARLVVVPGRDHLGTVPAREFKEAALAFLD